MEKENHRKFLIDCNHINYSEKFRNNFFYSSRKKCKYNDHITSISLMSLNVGQKSACIPSHFPVENHEKPHSVLFSVYKGQIHSDR